MPKYAPGTRHVGRNGTIYVVVDGKWQPMVAPKIDQKEDAEVVKLSEEAHNKRVLADASHDFMRMNEQTATGPGYAPLGFSLPHWLGGGEINVNPTHALTTTPGSPFYDPNVKPMEAISGRYAPQLRPVGSGPIRNMELEMFKKALPSIRNGGEDNARLTRQYEEEAQRARVKADFMRNYLHSVGNLSGAEEAFNEHHGKQASVPMVGAPGEAPKADDGGFKVLKVH